MLHKSSTTRAGVYKAVFTSTVLAFLVFNFNTNIVAQTTSPQTKDDKIAQNVLKYVITKDTKDQQLQSIKEKMAVQGVTIDYKNLERNEKKQIIGIRIGYDSSEGSGEFFVNSNNPIDDIAVTLNVDENKVSVGQAAMSLSQSFEIIKEDGTTKLKTSGADSDVFVYSTDDTDDDTKKVTVVGKDGDNYDVIPEKNTYILRTDTEKIRNGSERASFVKQSKNDTVWINENVKNIVWTDDEGNDVEIIAAEKRTTG